MLFLLVFCLNAEFHPKVERFAVNYLPIGSFPFQKVMYERPTNVNMDFTLEDGKLIFYRILRKKHLNQGWILIDQINLQVSEDSCKNWNTIFQIPNDSDIEDYDTDFIYNYVDNKSENYLNTVSMDVINSTNIVITGADTTGYILSLKKQSDEKWEKSEDIRFPSANFQPKELVSLDEKVSFCLIENISDNLYQILKTNDLWKTYKVAYESKYSSDYKNLNLLPKLSFLRKNQNKIKKNIIAFKYEFKNQVIIVDDDFNLIHITDFIDSKNILNIRVLNDTTIFVVTSEQNDNELLYSIYKSEDTGYSWDVVSSETNNTQYPYFDFKIHDENHFLIRGDYLTDKNGVYYKLKYTNDGGKNWTFLFPSNDSYYPNLDLQNGLFDFKNEYNQSAIFYQWRSIASAGGADNPIYKTYLVDYLNKEILLINTTNPLGIDASTYPKKFRLNEEYSFNCQECNFKDAEAPWLINYLLINTNENELELPNLSLLTYGKILNEGDTLKWQKVENATKYNVKVFKTGIFYPYIVEYMIDTTFTDTLLAMPVLKKGYGYAFTCRAETDTIVGRYSSLFASLPDGKNLLSIPNILTPEYKNATNSINSPDSIHYGEIKISWETVSNAKYYMLYIFEDTRTPIIKIDSLQIGLTTITKPIVIAENIEDTTYSYKYLRPNRIYQVTVWAENDFNISPAKTVYYALSDDNEVKEIAYSEQTLFPNPAIDYVTIDMSKYTVKGVFTPQEFVIYDVFGNKVLNVGVQNFEPLQKINVSALLPGVYFVRIGDEVRKFIKR